MKKRLFLTLAIMCIACMLAFSVSAAEHIVKENYTYANGFTSSGEYSAVCSCNSANCEYNVAATEKAPLFTIMGFSVPDGSNGTRGLSFGYQANIELVEEYERVNNCTVTYGFLLSGANNYATKPEKVKIAEFTEHYSCVDVLINYGEVDESGVTKYDKYDAIFAGRVTVENANGEKTTEHFQLDMPTSEYVNNEYGKMLGINYDTVIGKQNDKNKWIDGFTVNPSTGKLTSSTSSQTATNTYIKVKAGDAIGISSSADAEIAIFCYNKVDGKYVYAGYVDCNGEDNGYFGNKFFFQNGSTLTTADGLTEKIDMNELYVKIVCQSPDGEKLSYKDIEYSVLFNLINEASNTVTVTFKNGDDVSYKNCVVGSELGALPSVDENGEAKFLGWYDEATKSIKYDENTIINEPCVLVPVFETILVDIDDYIIWSQSYMVDDTGAYIASDASRFVIASFIKVNEGDSITLPSSSGYKFVIYCYSDRYGTYVADSIIDCNSSASGNWGYTYTFKNGDVLQNGTVLNCDNLYVRLAFKKDSGSVDIDALKNAIEFNVTANNSHLLSQNVGGSQDCKHTYGDWYVVQERDCYTDKVEARECQLCGGREVRYTQSTGHKVVIDPAIPANCGTDGYTEGSHCEICGTVIKKQQLISKDGLHQYNELVTLTTSPTTSSTGKGTFKCIICGATREETIDKILSGVTIGKEYVSNITTSEFNPAVDNIWNVVDGNTNIGGLYGPGNDWFGNVGDKLIITLDREITLTELKAYILGNWTFANLKIYDASGNLTKSASLHASSAELEIATVFSNSSVKAYTIEVEITSLKWESAYTFKLAELAMKGTVQDPRLPHTHVYNEFVKSNSGATCQVAGSDQYRCYCGMVTDKATAKVDHSYTVITSVNEATCTANGSIVYKCEYCSSTTTKTIEKTGHIYAKMVGYVNEPTFEKDGEAIFMCINCDDTENKTIKALELGKVEHLRVESIYNGVVTLKFNVYGEEANYEVRYSTSEITSANFNSATLISATVRGDKEYTVELNLNANLSNCYYVAIRPYIGGNYGEVTTIRVGGNKLIPIDYHSANVYSGEVLNSFAKLFDEQANERLFVPTSQLGTIITDKNDAVLYGMNLSPIVDLEYMHYVSSVYLYFANSGIDVTVRWSDTPVDAYAQDSSWDGVLKVSSTAGWNKFDINSNTRYIQIIFKDGSAPYEMLVYGYQNGAGDAIATEIGSLPTIGEMIGMCGFVAGGGGNTPIDSVSCTTVLREYHNFGWSYSVTAYPGKTSFFNNSWMANFDNQYRDYKRAGINVIPCVQWDVVNLAQSNKVDSSNLPVKSNGSFVKGDFWDKMNPHTYFMYADSMFGFAARYGTNSSTDLLNTLALHANDSNKVGLNYLEWIEIGNEPDGAWNGIHNYYSAYQIAALTSAAYDGHCRTMVTPSTGGYHLGLKNADPNFKGAMAGVSAVSNEYITAMCYWMKANRADGMVAFDAFNVHCYMTKQIELSNGSKTYVGISPEEAGIVNTLSQLIAIRDKYYPEKEVWITEFGWDTNQSYATSTSSHAYSNEETGVSYNGREVQAMWLTRTYLLLSAIGIDKATMYMCEDCGVEEESVGKYGTAGVIGYKYDENGKTVEFKKESYYYLYTLKNTLGDYTFNQKVETYDSNVYAYEYKTEDGKTAYAVWCGTSDGTVSNDYQLKIKGESATIVETENGNIYGAKTDVKADSLGYISVDVSEKPVYILVD